MQRDPSGWNLVLVPLQAVAFGAFDVWALRKIRQLWRAR